MTAYKAPWALITGLTAALASCNSSDLSNSASHEAELAEDIFAPLGEPLPFATDAQRDTFQRGADLAQHRFTTEEGLGPQFNVSFCGACHEKPVSGGGAGRYRNFLLTGARLTDDSFVPTGTNGVGLQFSFDDPMRVADDPDTNRRATRNPIPFFGVGLLAELENEDLLPNADPEDEDGDGISGRPNYDSGFVGRFGRKAQTVSIEGFIRGPLFNHLGITSNPLSNARRNDLPVPSGSEDVRRRLSGTFAQLGQAQAAAPGEPIFDDDGVHDPELGADDLFDLVSFAMLLAVPEPEALIGDALEGSELFREIGCTGCHVQTLTSRRGKLPVYSDLLLHDMGEAMADGIDMQGARGNEFRTQPLWGVAAVGPYLHDGRADTLEEAIEAHGGEAEDSARAFSDLTRRERAAVVEFLLSLGGRDQMTAGLLPPDSKVADVGEPGGPLRRLSADELQRFATGRAVFDRDFSLEAGLGPRFNGDACRACHFEPSLGGAGPLGVNVIRQGRLQKGHFAMPEGGTVAHRLLTQRDARAPIDPKAKLFEQRQTPSLFGLGLLERIPEEQIIARADPDDEDGDGISGRPHRLADGRLGRLGWKANVPTLAEFARDALSTEVGISVPPSETETFGYEDDEDDAADPEISAEDLAALVFFMENLAVPKPSRRGKKELAGEALFEKLRCLQCHAGPLETDEGIELYAYTDLLLHDVAPDGYVGIADGDAGSREFRTPPLWGLVHTGPYMHDGHAMTLEAAILAHRGEAEESRDGYRVLSPAEKAELLAFLESL